MVLETGVIVAGTGYAGSAIARALASDPKNNAPYVLLDKRHGEMLLDVIVGEGGGVAGALVVRDGAVEPVRAPIVVLATGNVGGLFPGGDWRASGDGLAIAHRAGLTLTRPHIVTLEGGAQELRASVASRHDGATALRGLFVAGSLASDRPEPEALARVAIVGSREGAEPFGPYPMHPTIDSPLPEGFAQVKFDRLRAIVDKAVRGELPKDRVLTELHRLKGEADEFARARVDLELFSLQNACEVALLLMKAA